MTDDALARASRALRDAWGGASAGAAETRVRVLVAAAARRRRRRTLIAWTPLAALLVVSTAWAAATGRVAQGWADLQQRWALHGAAGPATAHGMPRATGPSEASRMASFRVPPQEPSALPAATTAAGVANQAPSPVSVADVGQRVRASGPALVRRAADVSADGEERLFAAAHRAHFAQHDAASALRDWNAYLRAYPEGRFAPEARYNRALALVRLGRKAEAREALAPFANGELGGYRQHEARELLDLLGDE
jgi:hypothetical protein